MKDYMKIKKANLFLYIRLICTGLFITLSILIPTFIIIPIWFSSYYENQNKYLCLQTLESIQSSFELAQEELIQELKPYLTKPLGSKIFEKSLELLFTSHDLYGVAQYEINRSGKYILKNEFFSPKNLNNSGFKTTTLENLETYSPIIQNLSKIRKPLIISRKFFDQRQIWTLFLRNKTTLTAVHIDALKLWPNGVERKNCDIVVVNSLGEIISPVTSKSLTKKDIQNLITNFSQIEKNPQLIEKTFDSANIVYKKSHDGILFIALPLLQKVGEVKRSLQKIILFLICIFSIMSIYLMFIQSKRLSKNINKIKDTLSAFINNNFKARPQIFKEDEFQDLEFALDTLGNQLEKQSLYSGSLRKFSNLKHDLHDIHSSFKLSKSKTVISMSIKIDNLIYDRSPKQFRELFNDIIYIIRSTVEKNNGIINGIQNNQILILWGLPYESNQDHIHAITAAIELHKSLKPINQRFKISIKLAIGIEKGQVIMGRFDSQEHEEYSAIGKSIESSYKLMSLSSSKNYNILLGKNLSKEAKNNFNLKQENKNNEEIYSILIKDTD